MKNTLVAVSSNVRNNPDMSREKVRAAGVTTAKLGNLVGFQEIGEDEDHVDIRQGMKGFVELFGNVPNPIFYNSATIKTVSGPGGVILTHKGRAPITPNRYITYQTFQFVNSQTAPFVFINTHFINAAWNDKRGDTAFRKEMWLIHYSILKNLIHDLSNKGYNIIVVGDFNKMNVPKLHPNLKWASNSSIDKIGFINNNRRPLRERGGGVQNTTSDHNAHWEKFIVT